MIFITSLQAGKPRGLNLSPKGILNSNPIFQSKHQDCFNYLLNPSKSFITLIL